jgi:hypothetical protein
MRLAACPSRINYGPGVEVLGVVLGMQAFFTLLAGPVTVVIHQKWCPKLGASTAHSPFWRGSHWHLHHSPRSLPLTIIGDPASDGVLHPHCGVSHTSSGISLHCHAHGCWSWSMFEHHGICRGAFRRSSVLSCHLAPRSTMARLLSKAWQSFLSAHGVLRTRCTAHAFVLTNL